jgi:hypothetical protein
MNPLERVLTEDLVRTVEAVARVSHEGTLAFITAHHPELRSRIEAAESRLAEQRSGLLARYEEWQRSLEEMENLWALAGWAAGQPGAGDALEAAA